MNMPSFTSLRIKRDSFPSSTVLCASRQIVLKAGSPRGLGALRWIAEMPDQSLRVASGDIAASADAVYDTKNVKTCSRGFEMSDTEADKRRARGARLHRADRLARRRARARRALTLSD